MSENSDESDSPQRKRGIDRVPSIFLIVLLGWYLLLAYLTQLVEDGMPRVISEADIPTDNTDTFSEESAWNYLNNIIGSGPRVAGTEYHYNKTIDMKAMVDRIATDANLQVLTDWQVASGNISIPSSTPFLSVYQNVSNIIALLVGETGFHPNGTLGTSVLVNCHYDSVPFAMGASDNALFCAAMMESLSRMSRRRNRLRNNLVFLFNGAEEMGLLAAHGFLQHRWAGGVTAVVNLDSAGMNGKPSVFQVNDPRLLRAYRRSARRPNAQGLGEFLFATGAVPSDTDFRIFRDFGQIYGIDIAFTKWGHVYHTRYDSPDLLLPGVMQNAGDMLLALLDQLGNMDELDRKIDPPTPAVYYDYLNLFLVTYSLSTAYVVDVLVALFAALGVAYYVWLVGPRWSSVRELCWCALGRVLCALAGVATTLGLASIMIATTEQLRYLSHPWVVVPMFWIPYVVGATAASFAYDAWRIKKSGLNRSLRSLGAQASTRLLLTLALVIMLCLPTLQYARYLVAVPLLLMTAASLASLSAVRCVRLRGWQQLLSEVLLSTPATLFLLMLALRLDATMLPVMGRAPADRPDYTVAYLNVGLAALVATSVSGVELLFSRRRAWLPLAGALVACAALMLAPLAPYSDTGPATQRHNWMHSSITTYNGALQPTEHRAGVLVLRTDANTAARLADLPVRYAARAVDARVCAERVYCDLPVYRTSYARTISQAMFIDLEGPSPFEPAASLAASRSCEADTCIFQFTMIGGLHNTVTLWPRAHANLTAWSFAPEPRPELTQLSRPVYSAVFSAGTRGPAEPYRFDVTCTIPASLQSEVALDVSHHSHKIQHPEDFTEAYRTLIDSAPKYFNIAPMISFRNNYVF